MTETTVPEMTGIQKSAVLCLALEPPGAKMILEHLAPEELEEVTREMAALGDVDPETVRSILLEFQAASTSVDRAVHGGIRAARHLLEQALGEATAVSVLDRIREASEGALDHLEQTDPESLAGTLADEHPQTAAVILSHLDMTFAAKVVERLPPDQGSDILFRMAEMDKIMPDILEIIAEGIREKTAAESSGEMAAPGDPAKVAKMLTMTTGGRDQEILQDFEKRDSELAAKIKALMFVFEDLLLIDGKGIQRILREIDNKDLTLALKGASPELRKHIMSNMSERAGAAMEEEMELLGAVRVKDVEEAQQGIMEQVRELEDSGEVVVLREGEGDDFIS